MRKGLINLFYVIACIIFFLACSDGKENDLQKTALKGNIKSIREISYEAWGSADSLIQGGIIDNQGAENSYTIYNKKGYVTDIYKYDSENEIKYKWHFYYDKKQTKQLAAKRYEARDFQQDSTYYIYDKNGRAKEYVHCNENGEIKRRIIFKYDKKGNRVEERALNGNNLLEKITKCKYKKNKLVEGKNYDSNYKLLILTTYSYNKDGNMQVMTMVDGENKPISRGTYSYNKDGFVKTELLERPGYTDLLLDYVYTIDDKGNWVQRIMFSENEAFQITKREIEYY